jgi:hypothetical protein
LHIAISPKRHSAAIEFRAALTWGLVVFVLTLVILVPGAIVLPAQA